MSERYKGLINDVFTNIRNFIIIAAVAFAGKAWLNAPNTDVDDVISAYSLLFLALILIAINFIHLVFAIRPFINTYRFWGGENRVKKALILIFVLFYAISSGRLVIATASRGTAYWEKRFSTQNSVITEGVVANIKATKPEIQSPGTTDCMNERKPVEQLSVPIDERLTEPDRKGTDMNPSEDTKSKKLGVSDS